MGRAVSLIPELGPSLGRLTARATSPGRAPVVLDDFRLVMVTRVLLTVALM